MGIAEYENEKVNISCYFDKRHKSSISIVRSHRRANKDFNYYFVMIDLCKKLSVN